MKENRTIYVFYGVIVLMAFVFVIFISKIDSDGYSSLREFEKCFVGIVKEKSYGQAGSMIVLFLDKSVFNIGSFYKSDTIKDEQLKLKEWEQNSLNEFLIPGDSVFKPLGADTVFVYRKGIEYIFIDRSH